MKSRANTVFPVCANNVHTLGLFLSVIVVRRRVSLCVAMKVLLKEASPDPLT